MTVIVTAVFVNTSNPWFNCSSSCARTGVGACLAAPLTGWEKCGGGSATDWNCGPQMTFSGVQSSHNDFPWGVKSSIPYSVDSHTTAFAAV